MVHSPLILPLRRQVDHYEFKGQPELHSEFQASPASISKAQSQSN